MRLALLTTLLLGCGPRVWALTGAQQRLKSGDAAGALVEYDRLAARARTPADRALALTGAGLACRALGDASCTHDRLERASSPEVPGTTEDAFYYLAESLEKIDLARALNLYYRAAASAERTRARGFPYQAATDRILKLSLSR